MVDQEIEHLLEDIPQHQHDAQQGHTHEGRHAEGAEKVTVEDFQNKGDKINRFTEAISRLSWPWHREEKS